MISAMEACDSYKPWHDKGSGKTFLKPDSGKCLHYYFYFIDERLGLCYLRVPTWCPFRLQFYCNGHAWLARKLCGRRHRLYARPTTLLCDWPTSSGRRGWPMRLKPDELHRRLDRYAKQFCPVLDVFGQTYHWSLMQVEYSTDLIFRSEDDTQAAVRTALAPGGARGQGRTGRHLPRQEAHPTTRSGDRQPLRHPHRGHLHQAPVRQDRA